MAVADNRDLAMSRSNLYCDQCSEEATVFALQPPLKVKACALHTARLLEKHSSVFAIAAFDFFETPEHYSEYARRTDLAQKCHLTVLQERCESNRCEAHSHPRKLSTVWWRDAFKNCRLRWNSATNKSRKN